MSFKMKKIKKTNTLLNLIGLIIIFSLAFLGVYAVQSINLGNNKYKAGKGVYSEETKEYKKEIGILIVGRGGFTGGNDAPNLTDTIILAKINKDKKNVSLLSIQRDLYVNYATNPNEKEGTGKINSVYPHYLGRLKDETQAMHKLAEKIKDITGEETDYFVNVDFAGFKKIIDTLGGVEIDVKESFVDRTYPDGNWGYKTISFKKGLQTMDGEKALEYSRSRHSTSDFDRSLRQQQVIQAVKNKIMSSYTINSPAKVTELYNIFKENIFTDVSINDAITLALDLGLLKENYKFISSNFNDTCWSPTADCEKGGIIHVPNRELFGGAWVSLVNGSTVNSLSKYDLSRKYSDIVLNYPRLEEEDAKISIFNASKVTGAGVFVNNMKRYGFKFTEKEAVANAPETMEESIIYYNGIDAESDTIQALKKFFKGKFERVPEPKFSTQKAKIEIVIGKDYVKDNSIFNF
ncbi:hypothetical protein BLD25_02820 [Candidatus Gracilibacteria bacterium GN02-872]|nr:hypothetical protein BLD25_02820 [Candidatus Gracilibacteria bacterium GN02-872]